MLIGLGVAPFDDPGEGMHAEIASELLRSGDPFALTLSGARYVDKPPLLYALIAAAFSAVGRSELTARLIPALAALVAVAATAWLAAQLLGIGGGILAGAALLSSAGFYAYARYVRPETLLVAALAAGFALTLIGVADGRRRLTAGGVVVFGLAGLAKDPLAMLAPLAALAIALALAGRLRPITRWLSPIAVATALVLAFGWWALAELPWVTLSVWAVGVFALTALSPFRLPHYGLPAYFAIAVLAARAWRDDRGRALTVVHAAVFLMLGLVCAWLTLGDGATFMRDVLGATDVATLKTANTSHEGTLPPWSTFQLLLRSGAGVLATGAAALIVMVVVETVRGRRRPVFAATIVAITMLGMLPAVAVGLGAVAIQRAVRPVASEVANRAGADDVLVHEGPLEDSGALEWYAGRRPLIVDGRRSVLGFGATLDTAGSIFVDEPALARLWQGGRRVWLVTTRAPDHSVARSLPGARMVLAAGGRVLYVNRDVQVDGRAAGRR